MDIFTNGTATGVLCILTILFFIAIFLDAWRANREYKKRLKEMDDLHAKYMRRFR